MIRLLHFLMAQFLIVIAIFVAMPSAVAQQNNPPTANAIENPIVAANIPFTYTIPTDAFTDPENGSVTYTITMTKPVRTWLNIESDNGIVTLSGTPSSDAIGGTTITMTAQDPAGNTATGIFILNVREIPSVPTAWPLRPAAIALGDHFRLLVITSLSFETSTVTDITPYQNHAEDLISTGHTAIQPFAREFRVLLSSTVVDARDYMDTGLTTRPGVPIYWLNGDKVADDYDDFYDGDWDSRAARTELGFSGFGSTGRTPIVFDGPRTFNTLAYTGSSANGEKITFTLDDGTLLGPIGTFRIIVGTLSLGLEIYANSARDIDQDTHFYALSPIFAVNHPPTLVNPLDDRIINVGRPFTYTIPADTFSDAENRSLTYTITAENKPDWLNINLATMTISGTPTNINDAGDTVITVTATDNPGDSVVSSFTLTVVAPPRVPTIWPLKPDDTSLNPGDRFRLLFVTESTTHAQSAQITDYNRFIQDIATNGHMAIQNFSNAFRALISTIAVDARDNTDTGLAIRPGYPIYWLDGDKIADNYDAFYNNNWGSITGTDETGDNTADNIIIWTGSNRDGTGKNPETAGQANVETGQLTIGNELSTNNPDSSSTEHPLYAMSPVFLINYPPIQNTLLTNRILVIGDSLSYTIPEGAFSDPENTPTPLTYTANHPTWIKFSTENRIFTGIPLSGDTGVTTITVTVTDDIGDSVSGSFTLDIREQNLPPDLNNEITDQIPQERTLYLNDEFIYNFPSNAFIDPENNPLIYTVSGHPVWLTVSTENAVVRFNGSPRTYMDTGITSNIKITAIDHRSATASFTFTLTVLNRAPILEDTFNSQQTAEPHLSFYYTLPFTDPESQALTFLSNEELDWLNLDPNTGRFTGTPLIEDIGSNTEIIVTVTDITQTGISNNTTAMLTITVTAPEEVPGNWELKPLAVGPNDSFRLLFVTSGTRNAQSTDIETYNQFVQNQAADGHEQFNHSATNSVRYFLQKA